MQGAGEWVGARPHPVPWSCVLLRAVNVECLGNFAESGVSLGVGFLKVHGGDTVCASTKEGANLGHVYGFRFNVHGLNLLRGGTHKPLLPAHHLPRPLRCDRVVVIVVSGGNGAILLHRPQRCGGGSVGGLLLLVQVVIGVVGKVAFAFQLFTGSAGGVLDYLIL